MVDDILAIGGSLGQVVEAVARAGGEVVGVAVIVDRRPADVLSLTKGEAPRWPLAACLFSSVSVTRQSRTRRRSAPCAVPLFPWKGWGELNPERCHQQTFSLPRHATETGMAHIGLSWGPSAAHLTSQGVQAVQVLPMAMFVVHMKPAAETPEQKEL